MINQSSQSARRKAWVLMFVTSFAVAVLTFVVFGLFGGFMLMVGLNGMTGKQAEPIFLIYFIIVLGGCALVATLFNWLIIRRGFPAARLRSRVALVPAALASAGLLFVGPAIIFAIIRALG
jgi:hypothetical protein